MLNVRTVRGLTLALVCLLLMACTAALPQTTTESAPVTTEDSTAAGASASGSETALSGQLQFYPQNYYNPEARPEAAQVVEEVVADYMAQNPGVEIELVPLVGDTAQYRQFLLTRLAAGQAPNITWEQYSDRNAERDEVWVRLDEYLDQPNPYVAEGEPGSEQWRDLFPDYVLAQIRGGDGHWYEIAMDWVETGLFYNKDVFAQAGVEADWGNLTEFMDDCRVLRDSGVEPVGVFITPEFSTYAWLDDIFFSSAFADVGPGWYLEKYNVPGRDFRRLNPEETAKAIHDGKLTVDDPRFDVYLKLVKDFADACLMEGFAGGLTNADMKRLFVEGELAMVWLATADAADLTNEANFEFGLTYLPPITKAENEFAVHEDSSYRVGGPSGPAQWGITKATADAGLLEEAIDFLHFWSAPQNFQKVYDSYPIQVPMVAGVTPSEIAQQFEFVAAMPERLIGDPIARLTPEFGTQHNRLFQQYMLGEISAEELKAQYGPLLQEGMAGACSNNQWEWCE